VPVAGGENLYVFERDVAHPAGRLAFIATLSEEDSRDWAASDFDRAAQATPDGRFLVFQSVADLTPGDVSSQPQIFEYDASQEKLVRVSVGATGYADGLASADAHGALIVGQTYAGRARPAESSTNLAVSDDGSRVVFQSVGALAPGAEVAAAAGASSVYEYRSSGSIANGNVYLISDGKDIVMPGAGLSGVSASGGDVFFWTADPLLAQDTDSQFDLYDARVDGGFPAPVAPVCEGQACQGALPGSPSFGVVGSSSAPGGGDLPPSSQGSVVKPKARVLTRAQKLAVALRACRQKPRRKRGLCEAQARRRYRLGSNGRGKGGR
jgi:hypothetical protein